MSVVLNLSALALRQLMDGACAAAGVSAGEPGVEAVMAFLTQRWNEHRPQLDRALLNAGEHAWKALETALAGPALVERCQAVLTSADGQAFRQQLRTFVEAAPIAEPPARAECARELQAARQSGLLTGPLLDPASLVRQASPFCRTTDPAALAAAEAQLLQAMAGELHQAGHLRLAGLMERQPRPGPHLLVGAVRYFFGRQLETHPEWLRGVTPAPLQGLSPQQQAGFAALADVLSKQGQWLEELLADLTEAGAAPRDEVLNIDVELRGQGPALQQFGQEVHKLLEAHHLTHRELRASDSLSIRGETERRLIQAAAARSRTLTETQRRQLPALLNGIGKLQAVAGEFEAAHKYFQEVAANVSDRRAQAEVYANAYQASLEQRDWAAALAALLRAAVLDPRRFAPFPLDRFTPERILGAGGFGVVFLCRNRLTGSRVVIKALRLDGLERDVAEVFREAQVVEELDHPAIVRLRDCDYTDAARTRPYLVMDYFDGVTLSAYVEQHGPLAPRHALAVAIPAARALQAAHARGLLHRDVKPANLLVRRDGADWWVKLIDFGLALTKNVIDTTVSSSAVRLRTTIGGSVAGTLDYAAPEQMGRLTGVDAGPYSDVYSFGKTCYFALLGTPDPDDEEKAALPPGWRKLLSQCTARTVAKRLPDFNAVLEQLESAVEAIGSGSWQLPSTPAAPPPESSREEGPLAALSETIRRNPRDVDAYYQRGVAYAQQGAHDRAIADFTEVLRLDPRDAYAYANRGNSYRCLGNPDRAIADYDMALRLDQKYARAYINRGGAYEEKGDYERAIDDYIEALQLDNQNPEAYNALTWLWSTCPEARVRDGPRAVEFATAACELTGWQDANVLDTLAAAYAECGAFEEAVRWQKKALSLAPEERRAEFSFRVRLYEAGTPYRERPGASR